MTMDVGQPVSMTCTQTQEVTKVYDDGTADITYTQANMKMKMGDKELPSVPSADTATVVTVDKFGMPKDIGAGPGGASGLQFIYSALNGLQNGISVGESVPFDAKTPKLNSESKGTITLVDVTGGVADLRVVVDVTTADKPSGHVDGSFKMDVATAKWNSVDFTLTMRNGKLTHMTMVRQSS